MNEESGPPVAGAGDGAGGVGEPLGEFLRWLRGAGLRADAEGVADALWLAARMADAGEETAGGGVSGPEDRAALAVSAPPGTAAPGDRDTEERADPAAGEPYAPAADRRPARTGSPARGEVADGTPGPRPVPPVARASVSVASAFGEVLPLERALRPLQHYRPRTPPRRGPLDEAATAEVSARGGYLQPVFGREPRRQASLLLLMDDAPGMVVWDRTLEELRRVCERVGAFRDVAVHRLRPHPDGGAGVLAGAATSGGRAPGPAPAAAGSGYAPAPASAGSAPLAPADRLRDPTGRTVTLVLSDCSGPLWRRGAAQRLLHRWAQGGPVAVVQPLPRRMWPRTCLPAAAGTLRHAAGAPGRLAFAPRRRAGRRPTPGAVPVPVLSPTGDSLGGWARLLAGLGTGLGTVAGAPDGDVLDASAAWVTADHPGARPEPGRPRTPEQIVEDFAAVSSPAAQHLAVYLSAAPLAHPVMQIVQRAMMPQTGPTEMAEVLLSGLLEHRPGSGPPPGISGPGAEWDCGDPRRDGGPWYSFAAGVRDVLLRRLGLGEASLVLKHCSRYVERVFGRRAQNFPALVVGYLSGTAGAGELRDAYAEIDGGAGDGLGGRSPVPVPEQFAEVPRRVLARFQPGGVGGGGSAAGTPTGPAGPPLPPGPGALGAGAGAGAREMADGAATPPGGVVFAHHQRVLRDARARLERFRDQGSIRDLWEAIRQLRTAPQDPARPEWTVPQRTLLADCLLHLWRARRDPEVLDEALRVARSAADLAGLPGTAPGDPDRDAMAAEAHHVAARVLREAARAASRVTGTHPRGAPGADPARRGERRPPTPDPATLPTAPPAPRPGTDADPDLASAPDRASDARPDLARSPGPDRSADLTPAPDLASAPDRALDARPDLSPGPDLTPDRGPGQDADLTPDPDRGPGQGADPASAQCPGTDPLAPAQETPAATVASDPDALLREAGERLEPACEALRDRPELLFPVLITLVDVARDRYRRSGDHRALSAVLPRLDALLATWPPPPAPVLPLAAVRARGRVLLDLAAEARSRGDDAEARGLAVRATVDHAAAADLAATRGAPAAETVHGLLELADARAAVTGDPGAGVVIAELRRALRAAGRDGELRLPVLHRLGDAHYTGFLRTREVSCLLSAERAYAGAQLLVDLDDPVRAELLTGQGRALVARAERTGDLAVATDAVRLLRGALAETPDSDPRLAGRRLLFGRALRLHHAAGGALTDLHEAEWVLGRAARGAEGDGRIAADAWLERGDVLVALARHGSAPTRLDQAVDCYRRAAEAATRAADPLTAARAHHQRGAVLERTAGPVHAGEAYRAAWEQWERAGATGDPRARATRERMRALTDDDSP